MKLKGIPTTMRVFMYEPKIDDLVGNQEPAIDDRQKLYDDLQLDSITAKLSPTKATIVRALVAGDNFSQIGHDLHLKTNEIYKIKAELKKELAYLLDGRQKHIPFDDFLIKIKEAGANMPLNQFVKVFVCDYEKNANCAIYQAVNSSLYDMWENNSKNILFEDWQTKSIIVAGYILKTLFLRNKVISIDYYHNNRAFILALIKNIKAMIRVSPILRYDLASLKLDDDFMIKFADGSAVRVFHQRGRKPEALGNFVIVDDGADEVNDNLSIVNDEQLVINSIFQSVNPKLLSVSKNFV